MRPGRLCFTLAGCLTALAAGVAVAAPAGALKLDWRAPTGCPRAEEVRGMISGLLGGALMEEGEGQVQVRVWVRATATGYDMTIETRAAAGADLRRLQDARCGVLAEAAAMIAATAIDPSVSTTALPPWPPLRVPAPATRAPKTGEGAGEEAGEGAGEGGPTGGRAGGMNLSVGPGRGGGSELSPGTGPARSSPALAVEADEPGVDGGEPVARAERAVRPALRVGGVFDVGSTPGPTGGLTVAVGLLGELWRAELFGLWLAPRTARPARDLGARVGLLAGGLRGCVTPRVRGLEIPVCGALEAGALRGRGQGGGLGRPGADFVPWVAASVGPGVAWAPLRWLALQVQVDLVVPWTRAVFAVGGYGEVYRGASVAGRASVGLELRFR